MTKQTEQIRKLLREICEADAHEVYQGIVDAVNTDGTVDVRVAGDVVVPGVRLRIVSGTDTGIVITPKLGSAIVFAAIERGQDYQMVHASEIDRVYIRTGNTIMDIRQEGVIVNEGKLGGVAVIAQLKAQLNVLQANNTLLRAACSAMFTTLNALAPGISSAFEAAVAATQPLNLTNLENTKLKQ